jgi:hypothetical protein
MPSSRILNFCGFKFSNQKSCSTIRNKFCSNMLRSLFLSPINNVWMHTMKATHMFLKQALLFSGLAALILPSIAVANPSSSPKTPVQVSASTKEGLQTFSSSTLGFRISFPNVYSVDRSAESQGTIRLARAGAQNTPGQQPGGGGANKSGSEAGSILVSAFDNPNKLSAADWAKQNDAQSAFVSGRQSDYRSYRFAGQPAIAYSWCTSECGDSVVFPSRDGKKMVVISAVYELPGDPVRWEFQDVVGKFQFAK